MSLHEAAKRLRLIDPRVFEEFVKELEVYSRNVTDAVTDADQGHILVLQGRAQQCRYFLRVFQECHLERPTTKPPSI